MTVGFRFLDFDVSLEDNFSMDFNHNRLPIENSPERLKRGIICICTKGSADIEVDFVKYHIEEGVLLTAFPMQVVEQKYVSNDFTLVYVASSQELLRSVLFRFPPEFELFLKDNPVYKAPEKLFHDIIEFMNLLKTKYENTSNICRSEIIINMVRIHYLDIFNDIQQILSKNLIKHTRKIEIVKMFIQLLMQHFNESREVAFYANKLNITPKYLSIVTQEEKGLGAKKFIDDFMITEIKLQLKSTSKSIYEISNKLNFPDQSFFSKYFKHNTGLTPKQYRND